MEILGAVAIVLLVLACPLGMVAMGVVAWLVARARGQSNSFPWAACRVTASRRPGSKRTVHARNRSRACNVRSSLSGRRRTRGASHDDAS